MACAHWFADAALGPGRHGGSGGGSGGSSGAAADQQQRQDTSSSSTPPPPPPSSSAAAPTPAAAAENVLMFNCMKERDPAALLPALSTSLAQRGLGIHGALFVPPDSQYAFLANSKSAAKVQEINSDVSWQLQLRDVWERQCHSGHSGQPAGAAAAVGRGGAAADDARVNAAAAARLALPSLPGGC